MKLSRWAPAEAGVLGDEEHQGLTAEAEEVVEGAPCLIFQFQQPQLTVPKPSPLDMEEPEAQGLELMTPQEIMVRLAERVFLARLSVHKEDFGETEEGQLGQAVDLAERV